MNFSFDKMPMTAADLHRHLEFIERAARIGSWRWVLGEERPSISPGMAAMLGIRDESELRSGWILDRLQQEDCVVVAEAVRAAIERPRPFQFRARVRVPELGTRILDTSGDIATDANGKPEAIYGVCRDVTAMVEAEAALSASEANYRLLAEESNDIISRHGPDIRTTYISPAIKRILGYASWEILGTLTTASIHPDDVDVLAGMFRNSYHGDGRWTATIRHRHKQGHYVWLEVTARSLRDARSGRLREIVSVTRDVTERKNAELALEEALKSAEAASRTKSRFLANMSHELRTPLNAIIGFSEILKDEMFGPLGAPRYKEYAELINESGALLLDLINDILDMAKVEAGKYELHLEDIDAAEVVDGCLRLLRRRAEEAGITLSRAFPASAIPVHADRRALKQITLNLAANAIKFTPGGGNVRIELEAGDETLTLRVTDTGIGIAKRDLERIGQPFEQARSDAQLAQAGTGLGLALVRSLAEMHGGTIDVASEEGQGTTVTVRLPRQATEHVIAATAAA